MFCQALRIYYDIWHRYWNDLLWEKLTRLESSRGPVQWVVRIQGQAEKSQTGPPHLGELDSAAVVVVVMVKITSRYEITLNDNVLWKYATATMDLSMQVECFHQSNCLDDLAISLINIFNMPVPKSRPKISLKYWQQFSVRISSNI